MERKEKSVLVLMAIFLIGLISIYVILSDQNNKGESFIPPEFEKNIEVGIPDHIDEELDYRELKVSEELTISLCGNLAVNQDYVDIYFTSNKENKVLSKIKLLDEDGTLIGESGLIKPDEYLKSIQLIETPKESKNVIAKILTYEPDTYYSEGTVNVKLYLNVNEAS